MGASRPKVSPFFSVGPLFGSVEELFLWLRVGIPRPVFFPGLRLSVVGWSSAILAWRCSDGVLPLDAVASGSAMSLAVSCFLFVLPCLPFCQMPLSLASFALCSCCLAHVAWGTHFACLRCVCLLALLFIMDLPSSLICLCAPSCVSCWSERLCLLARWSCSLVQVFCLVGCTAVHSARDDGSTLKHLGTQLLP